MSYIICPACSSQTVPGPNCTYCGQPLPTAPLPQPVIQNVYYQQPRKSNAGKILLIVLAVVIGLPVLLIGGCVVLVGSMSKSAKSVSAGATSGSPSSTATADATDLWHDSTSTSEMDQKVTAMTRRDAEGQTSAYNRQELVVTCKDGQFKAYVRTGYPAQPEYGRYNSAKVRIRFDEGGISTQYWTQSTDDRALFAPNGKQLADQLLKPSLLRFEYTPFQRTQETITFDLNGFDKHYQTLLAECSKKPGRK